MLVAEGTDGMDGTEEPLVHEPAEMAPDGALLAVAEGAELTELVPEPGALGVSFLIEGTAVLLRLHDLVEHERHKDA